MTPLLIQRTLALHPSLTYRGFCPKSAAGKYDGGVGVITKEVFLSERADLLNPERKREVDTVEAWLSHIKPIQTCSSSSYSAKHWAERWGSRNGQHGYVSNGVLILVALSLGYPVNFGDGRINCYFGFSKKDVKRIDPQEVEHREREQMARRFGR